MLFYTAPTVRRLTSHTFGGYALGGMATTRPITNSPNSGVATTDGDQKCMRSLGL